MSDELTPFLSADGYLTEAAGWLEDLQRPAGHVERLEPEDDVCLEEAARTISRAVEALMDFGAENWHTPEARILDQESVDAANQIKQQFGAVMAWAAGGAKVELNVALFDQMKSFIRTGYPARFKRDQAFANALADSYDM